jgi:hypothetical protein
MFLSSALQGCCFSRMRMRHGRRGCLPTAKFESLYVLPTLSPYSPKRQRQPTCLLSLE